jgi:methylated-DNA-[protein]-cysteine S-methyltransferase
MKKNAVTGEGRYLSVYGTDRGWGGVVASTAGLLEVVLPFGGKSREDVHAELRSRWPLAVEESPLTQDAADRLTRYYAGEPVRFDLPVDDRRFTPFQREVYRVVAGLGYGEVLSYAGVAALAGSPGAARGVGTAMARNQLPVIIPCHRVVGAGGNMGGYSAPGGIASKQRLLEMEGVRITTSGRIAR